MEQENQNHSGSFHKYFEIYVSCVHNNDGDNINANLEEIIFQARETESLVVLKEKREHTLCEEVVQEHEVINNVFDVDAY